MQAMFSAGLVVLLAVRMRQAFGAGGLGKGKLLLGVQAASQPEETGAHTATAMRNPPGLQKEKTSKLKTSAVSGQLVTPQKSATIPMAAA